MTLKILKEVEYFFRRVEKAWILRDPKMVIPSYCQGHNDKKQWFKTYKN